MPQSTGTHADPSESGAWVRRPAGQQGMERQARRGGVLRTSVCFLVKRNDPLGRVICSGGRNAARVGGQGTPKEQVGVKLRA